MTENEIKDEAARIVEATDLPLRLALKLHQEIVDLVQNAARAVAKRKPRSAESRAKLAAAMKARWAASKASAA